MSMDVCPEEEAASVHLHGGAFKAGDDLYAFLLVCEQIKNALKVARTVIGNSTVDVSFNGNLQIT